MKKTFLLLLAISSLGLINSYAKTKFIETTPAKITVAFVCDTLPAQDSLNQYAGKYKFPEGSPVTEIDVAIESGKLTATSPMGSSELRRSSGDEFEIVAYGGTATFRRNTEGKVNGLHILVGDVDIEGTKSEGLALHFQ